MSRPLYASLLAPILLTGVLLLPRGEAGTTASPAHEAAAEEAAATRAGAAPGTAAAQDPRSPHWPHIRLAATVWHIQPGSPAVAWMARHYDAFMSGPLDELHARNPAGIYMPYAMIIHVPVEGHQYSPGLEIMYQQDMRAWYDDPARNTGGWQYEDAFLHTALPKTPETRKLTPVDPHSPWNNIPWYAMNVGDPGFRAYQVDRFRRFLGLNHPGGTPYNAVFIDVAGIEIGWGFDSVEYATPQALIDAYVGLYQTIRPQLRNLPFFLNVSSYHPAQYPFLPALIHAAGGSHQEFILNAASEWGNVVPVLETYLTNTTAIVKPTSNQRGGDYDFLGAGNHTAVNNLSAPLARGYMVELAQYYMAMPMEGPARYYLSPGSPSPEGWFPPYAVDIGRPAGAYDLTEIHAGQAGGYLAVREFTEGLVVARVVGWWLEAPEYGDAGLQTFDLPPGVWRRVREDGSLEAPSTTIDLRLAEAAIFVRE